MDDEPVLLSAEETSQDLGLLPMPAEKTQQAAQELGITFVYKHGGKEYKWDEWACRPIGKLRR
ncbi:hypothetical protein ABTX34_30335 [Streptomyces sp. NPDC096538]|uniref:hypothetical protein n=1 Tax=Streptomyces sp. NPDC096538 TaxID=3155427 RepID=UPI00332163B8